MRRPRRDPTTRMPLDDMDPTGPELDPPPRLENAPPASCVELYASTAFTFLAGASHPEEMVAQAVANGMDTLGVADAHGLYGVVRAHAEAKRLHAKVMVGCALQVEHGDGRPGPVVVLHPMDRSAYARLCRIITRGHLGRPKGTCRTTLEDLAAAAGNMACTVMPPLLDMVPGDISLFSCMGDGRDVLLPEQDPSLKALKDAFGPWLHVALVRRLGDLDGMWNAWAYRASAHFQAPMVATTRPLMHGAWRKPPQDVLTCIRLGVKLQEAGTLLHPNAEARLLSPLEMEARFMDAPAALDRTRDLADACQFSLSELRYKFPSDRLEAGQSSQGRLEKLTWEGAAKRYGGVVPDAVGKQLRHELGLIEKLDVAPYFLTVHDIVDTARARQILCQGRGSAANSAVCYVLGITSVDPVQMQLLFERFLSVERAEPPDIDVDFEHERREEVIQDIYNRWGRHHAGMVCEVICYRGRSALREAGKVAGLDEDALDVLSGIMMHSSLKQVLPERIREAGLDPNSPELGLAMFVARALQGYPRHIGVHVGGFVLTHDPLVDTIPIEPATMEDRTVIQWDKDDLDTLGIFKMDVLGLGMLTALRKTMDLVRQTGGPSLELYSIPADDPATYAAIQKADTVGVFQIESRAQMSMLPRLKPAHFYDLVVEVAIVRPGPIQGDMVHPYLRRRQGLEAVEYPHPALKVVLERTLGVPLFQEQVMKMAMVGAGYTPGEADQLRRDMAAWKKNGRLARHKDKLMAGFAQKGIAPEFVERLYKQIQGFGEYGFPESHAASFALLTYASSYLKTHHPAAFVVALINSQPMGFYSPSSLIQDVQRHGVTVLPIHALQSLWDCTLEKQAGGAWAVRLGMRLLKGVSQAHVEMLVAARLEGRVTGVEGVMGAAPWRPGEVQALTQGGALDALSGGRREALWDAMGSERGVAVGSTMGRLTTGLKFKEEAPTLPGLSRLEVMLKDYAHTGLSVDDHPLKHMRPLLARKRIVETAQLAHLPHGSAVKVAGLVVSRQQPGTASGVVFVTLEDETGTANVVLWQRVFEQFYRVARGAAILEVRGRLERDAGVIHVIAQYLEELPLPSKDFQTHSRDFH